VAFYAKNIYTQYELPMRFVCVFTAPRVCIARTMPWQNVCPSLCLFVCQTPVFCLNGYTYPQTFFTIGYPYNSRFCVPSGMAIFRQGPPNRKWTSNARGYKNYYFRPIFRFISEMMQERAMVTMEGEFRNRTQAFKWYQYE